MPLPMLVTGLPRSGKTFIASVLSQPEHAYNIGEPFLHRVGTDHHYPYCRTKTTGGARHDQLLRQVFRYKKLFATESKRLTRLSRGYAGTCLGPDEPSNTSRAGGRPRFSVGRDGSWRKNRTR